MPTSDSNHQACEGCDRLLREGADIIAVKAHMESCPSCQKAQGQESDAGESFAVFLSPCPPDSSPNGTPAEPDAMPPLTIPGYEVGAKVGGGGFGDVYEARQLVPDRPVAIKVLRCGDAPPIEVVRRFVVEAQTLAKLEHENIVRVIAVGEHAGCPHLVMEYAPGGTLEKKIASLKSARQVPPERQAAEIVSVLARAVQYAHNQNVIHRDLKPANVLLGRGDVLKIADFGLAKQLDESEGLTQSGQIFGTRGYMAPEQFHGKTDKVGPAADVYALGVIFHELLTGCLPPEGVTLLAMTHAADSTSASLRKLRPKLDRRLEQICLRCLEKDPVRRPSAAGLVADLQLYLNATSPWRARVVAGSLALVAAVGLVLVFGVDWNAQGELHKSRERESDLARQLKVAANNVTTLQQEQDRAKDERQLLAGHLRSAVEVTVPKLGQDLAAAKQREDALAAQLKAVVSSVPELEKRLSAAADDRKKADGALAEATIVISDLKTRLAEVEGREKGLSAQLDGLRRQVTDLQQQVAAEAASRKATEKMLVAEKAKVANLDEKLAAAKKDADLVPGLRTQNEGLAAKLKNAEAELVKGGANPSTPAPAARKEATWATAHTDKVTAVAFSPDSKRVLTTSLDKTVRVWEVESTKGLSSFNGHKSGVGCAAVSPDGKQVVSGGLDNTVRVWNVADGAEVVGLTGHTAEVRYVAFRPNGTVVSVSLDGTARVWDMQAKKELVKIDVPLKNGDDHGHDFAVATPDGSQLVVYNNLKRTGSVWDLKSGDKVKTWKVEEFLILTSLSISPDGQTLAFGNHDGGVRLRETTSGKEVGLYKSRKERITAVAFTADGKQLIFSDSDYNVFRWDISKKEEIARGEVTQYAELIGLSPDGQQALTVKGSDRKYKLQLTNIPLK